MDGSPFLSLPASAWVASNELTFALRDRFPVSPGHTLVVPKRLVATWFEATREEQHALLALVDEVKRALDLELRPDGYNVGFNAGVAAGQTVAHLHVHVIPRFLGDVPDPRGGVRGVIPGKQKYAALEPGGDDGPFSLLPAFVHGDEMHFERILRAALLHAEQADIVSAFVQTSGVNVLYDDLRDALRRGARVRLLAGDYMGITSPDALRRLLSLADEQPAFAPYLYEVEDNKSFHPKAYIFVKGTQGVAYVGSSNLSGTALRDGIEWNLRLVSSEEAETFRLIRGRFLSLLENPRTQALSRAVIDAYELRAPERPAPGPEPRAPLPVPTALQREALKSLSDARREGKNRGLVVLATGLGKTYLSAFDFKAMGGERALFVAHREEILEQAKDSWQRVFPDKLAGTYRGGKREKEVDLLFASVQTLARSAHLAQFLPHHFDYIVVDEFHHAAAATYRKILGHFAPRFLLGLTATPERMDGRSLLDLCGDNLVFRRNLVHGISARLLVPFRYFGVKDEVDFAPIPWRSGRFAPEALTAAVTTEARAEQALREYERRAAEGARRTLCFCCTVEHADFMAAFFRARGKQAVAVHSGEASAPRAQSLRALRDGELEIICAVDVFNEGLDVPDINTVLMLRPTESPVIFLQQLGRGLRRADGKEALVVVDFIGNHRSFLSKPQSLVLLLGEELPPRVALEKIRAGTLDLPEGCSVEIETDAIELLASMVQVSRSDIAVYEYLTFRDAHGRRPSAAELFQRGVGFEPIRKVHASWFDFVRAQGDLTDDEQRTLERHADWFRDLLRTRMTKAYKMTSLRALLDANALFHGMDVEENARRSFQASHDDLLLYRELREDEDRRSFGAAFVRKWRQEPLQVWGRGESTSRSWFRLEGDSFVPTFSVGEEDRETFEEMTEEMVELRIAEHRDRLLRRTSVDATQAPIVMQVSHSGLKPILRFDRARRLDIPTGPTFVEVDGEVLRFDFKKIAVKVATREGSSANVLPEVLRRMFGPSTGQPGIRHRARLVRDDAFIGEGGWHLQPEAGAPPAGGTLIELPRVPCYADVKVACGAMEGSTQQSDEVGTIQVRSEIPLDPTKHFVVRAEGDSMNGGETPIEDGDLVLCEWTPNATIESVVGKAVLLTGSDAADTAFALIKVPRRTAEGGWRLESWSPASPPFEVRRPVRLTPVARVLRVVEEPLGLVLYGEYDRDAIAAAFGSKNDPSWKVGHRDIDVSGAHHTVLMVTLRKGGQTKVEHRYADRFLSPTEMQWESQASTKEDGLKGRRIRGVDGEARAIHLFVQYDSHKPFSYLGPVKYLSHEGEAPMRVRLGLESALPEALWKMWG
jgi:superfamily II DNA or RNA helicase/diadenosine tetraphosphate (Ap4A) HIT family hydrolase/HKD family nuclease